MELTDTHSHTVYSGHGEGLPSELLAEALAQGLTTLAITEHLTLPTAFDPDGLYSMLPDQAVRYQAELASAQEHAQSIAPGFELIAGVEVDWRAGAEGFLLAELGLAQGDRLAPWQPGAPSRPEAPSQAKPPYQLLLCSVHMLTGEDAQDPDSYWPLDYTLTIDGWYERGRRYVWERYVGLWLDALLSQVPFDIMSHPDLPKKLGFAPDFDAAPLWRQMAEAAAARGVMIELNTSGLFAPCAEVYPGPALLAEFCRAGVPCTISSDAHTPLHLGRANHQAKQAMIEAGYTHITVPRPDGDRRQIALT